MVVAEVHLPPVAAGGQAVVEVVVAF